MLSKPATHTLYMNQVVDGCAISGSERSLCVRGQGVMFWRWDAVNTVNLGEGDNALTIGLNSNTFQVRPLYNSWSCVVDQLSIFRWAVTR